MMTSMRKYRQWRGRKRSYWKCLLPSKRSVRLCMPSSTFSTSRKRVYLALKKKYWEEFNSFQLQLWTYQEERDCLRSLYEHASTQLAALRKTNFFNDAFNIWHEGHFGTINGFRLGRLQALKQVDWPEINAGLGQVALAVDTLGKHIGVKFSTFRIQPTGSFSRVSDGKNTYELFGSSEWKFTLTSTIASVYNSSLNKALVGLLSCLDDILQFAQKEDPNFKIPYIIKDDTIGGVTIRSQTREEKWTKALKYLLTNVKYVIYWVAQRQIRQAPQTPLRGHRGLSIAEADVHNVKQ
eukprot:Rmarinus@m.11318